MNPSERTPQQRDRRFARVRRLADAILMASVASAVIFVGYASNTAHVTTTTVPVASAPTTRPTTRPTPSRTTPTTPSVPVALTTSYDDREGDDSTSLNATAGSPTVPVTPTTTKAAPSKTYTPPTKAPVTKTPVCTTTPSGRMVCH